MPANPVQFKLLVIGSAVAAILAAALVFVEPLFIVAGLVGLAFVWLVVERPFVGVMMYIFVQYFRPGEVFPALAPLRPALVTVGLLAVSIILRVIVRKELRLPRHKILTVLLYFLFVVGATAPFAFWKSGALDTLLLLGRYAIGLFFVLLVVDSWRRVRWFLYSWVGVMGLLAAWNNILYYTGQKWSADTGGSSGMGHGFMGDGNDFALALNMAIPFAIVLSRSEKKMSARAIWLLVGVACVISIVATASRGGFLGLAVSLFTLLVFYRASIRTFAYLAGASVGAVLVVFLLLPTVWERDFAAFFDPDTNPFLSRVTKMNEYEKDESAQGRLDAWGASVRMFVDQPFTGVGAGCFDTAYGLRYKPDDAVSAKWRAAHSIYFQVLGELGLPGILGLFGMFFVVLLTLKQMRARSDPGSVNSAMVYGLAGAGIAAVCSFAVCGAFLSAFYYPHIYQMGVIVAIMDNLSRADAMKKKQAEDAEALLVEEFPV